MSQMPRRHVAIAASILLAGALSAQAETLYTDRTAFALAANTPLSTETFPADIANASSITFAFGIQSVGANGLTAPLNGVATGLWTGKIRTAAGSDGYVSVTWTFPRATKAFGVDWSSISSSRGVTLTGNWDGTGNESLLLWDALGANSTGFVGIIGTANFSQITLTAEGTGDNDVFSADNVAIAAGDFIFADGFESNSTNAWSASAL